MGLQSPVVVARFAPHLFRLPQRKRKGGEGEGGGGGRGGGVHEPLDVGQEASKGGGLGAEEGIGEGERKGERKSEADRAGMGAQEGGSAAIAAPTGNAGTSVDGALAGSAAAGLQMGPPAAAGNKGSDSNISAVAPGEGLSAEQAAAVSDAVAEASDTPTGWVALGDMNGQISLWNSALPVGQVAVRRLFEQAVMDMAW